MQIESDIIPYELGFYLGQSSFEYWSVFVFARIDVRYDNGNWITLAQNSPTTGQFTPPWNTLGEHTMDFKYWYVDGITHELKHKVYVVPAREKIYYDDLGNWVSVWTGTTRVVWYASNGTTSKAYLRGRTGSGD